MMEIGMIMLGILGLAVLVWLIYELTHPYWAKDDEEM